MGIADFPIFANRAVIHQRRKQCSQQLFKGCEPASNENDLSRLGSNGHGGSNQILAFYDWG
jgi:hypothetical protein